MLNILLVEDEKLLLDDLHQNINWGKYDMQVVATACTGAMAYVKACEHLVHIVVTDIKLPGMDGIELSKKLRKQLPDIQIIFITGYDEVEYFRTAIDVEAVAYLSKPVCETELEKALLKATSKLTSNKMADLGKQVHINRLLKDVALGITQELPKDIFLELQNDSFLVVLFKIDNFAHISKKENMQWINSVIETVDKAIRLFLEQQRFYLIYMDNGTFLAVICSGDFLSSISMLSLDQLNTDIQAQVEATVSLCVCDEPSKNLNEAYQKANKALEYLFFYANIKISLYSAIKEGIKIPKEEISSIEEQFFDCFYKNKKKESLELLDLYFENMRSQKIKKHVIIANLYNFVNKIYSHISKLKSNITKSPTLREDVLNELETFDNLEAMKQYLVSIVRSVLEGFSKENDNPDALQVIPQVIEYIEQYYHNQITVESICSNFYFAASTLRSVFKDYTGKTIHEYLTQIRMSKALEMISDTKTKLQIKDIARKVGFDNVSYFCILFSKHYGLSPNQYRQKLLGINV